MPSVYSEGEAGVKALPAPQGVESLAFPSTCSFPITLKVYMQSSFSSLLASVLTTALTDPMTGI